MNEKLNMLTFRKSQVLTNVNMLHKVGVGGDFEIGLDQLLPNISVCSPHLIRRSVTLGVYRRLLDNLRTNK
jgi:hypothetical protein